jgi:hypothetical protein
VAFCSIITCVGILQQLPMKQSGSWNWTFLFPHIYAGSRSNKLSDVWIINRSLAWMMICQ